MILNIDATPTFEKHWDAYNDPKVNTIVSQGGSRSGKTYSIVQLLILIALNQPNLQISIVRKSFPSLRSSVLRDWKEIMFSWDIYDEDSHSKTEHIYTYPNGSTIEFFSLDDSQKVRGRKRDILYCNEANEIDLESWIQLKMRTTGKIFIDYNPSELEHWTYDLIEEDDTQLIKSTYKDNPFLSEEQVEYIENLMKVDEQYYRVYALGERPTPRTLIYNHFVKYEYLPDESEILETAYGLDIGYNHSTAFVEVNFATDNRLYVKEVFYENEVTVEDIVRMIANSSYDRTKMIYVDSARPDIMESLRRKGIRSSLSDKRVKEGIDYVKSHQVLVHLNSDNIWRESRMYSWKETRDGIITDEIVKKWDDGLDAFRYAAFTAGQRIGKPATPFTFGR